MNTPVAAHPKLRTAQAIKGGTTVAESANAPDRRNAWRARSIVIALGANLQSRMGAPRHTLKAALAALARNGIRVVRCSPFYGAAAVPRGAGPPFVNAIALVETMLRPKMLLARLNVIERRFGRAGRRRNAPRTLDLDLVDYRGLVLDKGPLVLPHPRAHRRRFVLLPLAQIAPAWRHPTLNARAVELSRMAPRDPIWRLHARRE